MFSFIKQIKAEESIFTDWGKPKIKSMVKEKRRYYDRNVSFDKTKNIHFIDTGPST